VVKSALKSKLRSKRITCCSYERQFREVHTMNLMFSE